MIELFGLVLLATGLSAAGLCLIGRHVILRGLSFYLLPLHQGAILISLVLSLFLQEGLVLRLAAAALATLAFSMYLKRSKAGTPHELMIGYVVLLALNLLLIRLHPGFELSVSRSVFGDIAILSPQATWVILGGALLVIILELLWGRDLFQRSFELNVFGMHLKAFKKFSWAEGFFVSFVSFCLLELGLLFSMGALLLSSLMISRVCSTWRSLSVLSSVCAGLGTLMGFWVSLQAESLSSTAAAVLGIFVISLVVVLGQRFFFAR